MERGHPSYDEDMWAPAEPETSDIIDPQETEAEPTGFALLESKYGHMPEELANNTALALLLLTDETENTLVTGKDASVFGEKSQPFLDSILTAMTAEEPRAGYAGFLNDFIEHAGSTPEKMKVLLTEFVENKTLYLNRYSRIRPEVRSFYQEKLKLRETLNLLRYASKRHIDRVLSDMRLPYEGGKISEFDPELFHEYCGKFLKGRRAPETAVSKESAGMSREATRRLAKEAEYEYS